MRIAHLIWGMRTGGAETMLVDLANTQARTNEVGIFVANASYDSALLSQISPKVHVRLLKRPIGSRNPWYWVKLNAQLATFSPDILHAHQEGLIRFIAHSRVPKILTIHTTGTPLSPDTQRFDLLCAVSQAVRLELLHRAPRSSSLVILNGIRSADILPKTEYAQRHPFRIVQIGRLYPEIKGQDILLRAVRRVLDTAGPNAVTVDFIGGGATPSVDVARKTLESLALELGMREACHFLGEWSRKRVYTELYSFDLMVQPSRIEGFGLTIVEAMNAKVPVLVSSIDGPMEVIAHGLHGASFRVGDHVDCANKILAIMQASTQSGFCDHMQAAADYAQATFDITCTAQAYLWEYQRLLQLHTLQAVI